MQIGMVWFDDSQSPIEYKIRFAVKYYNQKYGEAPNLIMVHPSMSEETIVDGIQVKHSRSVLPQHFWVGRESVKER